MPRPLNRVRPGLDWERLNRNVSLAVETGNGLPGRYWDYRVSIINQQGVDVKAAAEEYWGKYRATRSRSASISPGAINQDHSADAARHTCRLPKDAFPVPWLV